jgi:hypothetical protein
MDASTKRPTFLGGCGIGSLLPMLIVQTLAEEKEARPHSWDTQWILENTHVNCILCIQLGLLSAS